MDQGGPSPQKTFVSTFHLVLKPSAPKFVERGAQDGHRRNVQGNSKLKNASKGNEQTPTHPLKDSHVKEPLRNCKVEAGSDDTNNGIIAGSQSLSVSLLHNGPPVEFKDSQEQVEVRAGEPVRLHCVFTSLCLPVVSCWVHNREKVLVNGPRNHVKSGETESCVEISQTCPDDAGSYTLVVRNRRGCAYHTVVLSVKDRPHRPASSPIISQLSSKSLVLSWTGPSYDGGSAITGYIVEVRQEVPDKPGDWTELTTHCMNTSYRVRSGLEPLGQYRFRVRASNSVGTSEPSNMSDCVKMDTKGEKKEEPESYVTFTIDTKNKVKDHYNIHEKLGVGKYGQVFRLVHRETAQVHAGKFYKGRSSKEKAAALREIELMNCLHHPKLVQCLGAYHTRSEIVMVLEYIAGGELFERIVDENYEYNEPTCARYMQQLLEGIQYVHKQNIIHLDLKPENIVCVDTTGTRIKIIDFGLAHKLEPGVSLTVLHGTPEFVAPEVINYEPVSLKTDMWSIGVICFVLLSGESPFQGNSDTETLAQVTAACYKFDEDSFEDISDQAKYFIDSLLKKDIRCRLSCDEALAHHWLVSFTSMIRRPTKSLRKDKMKHFLARRKWRKTGKAVLALQRMANLSSKPYPPCNSGEEPSWGPEAKLAIQSLEKKLEKEPYFDQVLKDTTLPSGATARLACHIQGHPKPQVEWLHDGIPVEQSARVTVEYEKDGLWALVLTDLVPADSGVYECRATNDRGRALSTAKLTVEL
ncbi:myosin light chain kinase, smooth muscle-like isoform X1 [Hypomesus transpacificus]|uniref:myosin light chain kinase, smooth muscle-like isoform X1 n=1 Tax=Hypomesus transpacificus TaxID=137520 RepID=UPI001F0748AE|nr:myosin light chain kinase, smooth muscle-like isoform X1 [Hypomesus transpacificus]XP_046887942.1 myosin light chain kinase, smooth muscle-like isoform X1 [Hypomesus transpacificus]XP_046887943.1 myosin light chain kinase, smooth muscle-like isoform X1 [Hypomesus transpacificus]